MFEELNNQFFQLPQTVKKIAANERAAYIDNTCSGPYYYVTDHTAFECSATKDMQENLEMRVYEKTMGKDNMEFVKHLTDDQDIMVVGDGRVSVPCSRMSGEMNTSLGNSITNMVFIEMIMEKFNVKGNYYIEGDDGLLCFESELDIDAVQTYAAEQGFVLKIEPAETAGSAGFLSMKWNDTGVYRDNLGHMLTRSVWKVPHVQLPDDKLLLARIASLMMENENNHVLHALYVSLCKKYSTSLRQVKIYKPNTDYDRMKLQSRGVDYRVESNLLLSFYAPVFYPDVSRSIAELSERYNLTEARMAELVQLCKESPEKAVRHLVEAFGGAEFDVTH